MFKKLSNWWNRNNVRLKQTEEALARIEAKFEKQQELLKRAEEKVEQAEEELTIFRAKHEKDKTRYTSTEPWIEVKSVDYNPVRGIQFELDWNEAFIQHLKENGITGRDEDHAVQKYLALLYDDLIQRFEQKAIDNSDKPRINDFE